MVYVLHKETTVVVYRLPFVGCCLPPCRFLFVCLPPLSRLLTRFFIYCISFLAHCRVVSFIIVLSLVGTRLSFLVARTVRYSQLCTNVGFKFGLHPYNIIEIAIGEERT